jgi:hypothetical protein
MRCFTASIDRACQGRRAVGQWPGARRDEAIYIYIYNETRRNSPVSVGRSRSDTLVNPGIRVAAQPHPLRRKRGASVVMLIASTLVGRADRHVEAPLSPSGDVKVARDARRAPNPARRRFLQSAAAAATVGAARHLHADTNFNPPGVRGIGEIGITGIVAAVANAVHHATGVRVRDLPITLDKVFTPLRPDD